MKDNADRLLESVVEKVMKSSHIESPSSDFTKRVMAHVNTKSTATVYQPLISKTGWLIVFSGVIAFVIYIYMITGTDTSKWFETIDFNVIATTDITNLFSKLKLEQVTSYAMLVFGLMLCAQIPILKYFIDKRQRNFS
ncbi:hypothetical protein [Gelidibacter salicanalis]|uniref:Uncharacterized protein n=1 Tax=Gelidibacter salicanalis TaxID=291193 RepID=A0A934NH95_9FLAO|nr:hypothetical protein [Gelidibacter salicanalis]MBJ7879418.1 hypothetical protein [Gelidibacter salicanalis]